MGLADLQELRSRLDDLCVAGRSTPMNNSVATISRRGMRHIVLYIWPRLHVVLHNHASVIGMKAVQDSAQLQGSAGILRA